MTRADLESKIRQDSKTKIKFVRIYYWYSCEYADIVYKSNRVHTVPIKEMPSTAVRFCQQSTRTETQYDSIFKRDEVLYF